MRDNLRNAAAIRFPKFGEIISCDSTLSNSVWESDLSSGKALEVISLLRIIDEIGNKHKVLDLNSFYTKSPYCFYARNEIPLHHGAQAGHEANLTATISLEERFISSITPKITFSGRDGNHWMIFREGNPLHLLFELVNGNAGYKDRCDIVLVRGTVKDIEINGRTFSFCHTDGSEYARYELTIKNSSIVPLKNFDISPDYAVKTSGVIECSVSKKKDHVDAQLMKYQKLFSSGGDECDCLFIHGDDVNSRYTTIYIDLSNMISSFDAKCNQLLLSNFIEGCIL